jgi:pentapeptide MXKDX repeat protein
MVRLLRAVFGIVLLVSLSWGVVGCNSSPPTEKDKMGKDKMMDDKMGKDKMMDDKMGKEKMSDDKMGADKMAGDKMGTDKK